MRVPDSNCITTLIKREPGLFAGAAEPKITPKIKHAPILDTAIAAVDSLTLQLLSAARAGGVAHRHLEGGATL
jgi:hypothetical protein